MERLWPTTHRTRSRFGVRSCKRTTMAAKMAQYLFTDKYLVDFSGTRAETQVPPDRPSTPRISTPPASVFRRSLSLPEDRLYAGNQFIETERLDDEVRGACLQATHHIFLVAEGCEHDDRNRAQNRISL